MASLWFILVLCLTTWVSVSTTPDKTIFDPLGDHDGDKIIFKPYGNHGAPKSSHGSPKGHHDAPKGSHDAPKGNHGAPNAPHVAPKRGGSTPKGPRVSPKQKQARPFFVFGDSLVDNGNNNFLITGARADMPPYGIDSPDHSPTGRFSNGLNIPDVISEYIGSEPTLPYLNPQLTGQKLLIGANFASAGVGILNDTGFQFLNVLRMPLQLEYFKEYQQRLSLAIGDEKAKQLVNRALVLISLGGNDFINNYYLFPGSARSQLTSLSDYVTYLIVEYRKILEKLYELGARRVIVMGSGPLGCAPAERMQHSKTGDCATDLQAAAALFEPQLTQMVQDLNAKYHADVFVAANTKLMNHDMITDPKAFGFKTSTTACCGQGPFNGFPGLCTMTSNLCQNRDEYVFWDAFHPTERACRIIVQQIMNGTPEYMKPVNLSVIMAVDSKM
ncbi:putative triacylglycerol lipase [Helianthus anomalus]